MLCQHVSLFSFPLAFQELGSSLHICSCSHPAKVKGHCMNHLYVGKKSIHAAHWAPYGTGLIDFRREMTEKTPRFRVWSHPIRNFSFLGALGFLFLQLGESDHSKGKLASLKIVFSYWRRTSLPTKHRSSLMEPSSQTYHLREVFAVDITSTRTRGNSYYWRPQSLDLVRCPRKFHHFSEGKNWRKP